MKKSEVNGDNTNEVFKWLKSQKHGILGLARIKVRVQALFCIVLPNLLAVEL